MKNSAVECMIRKQFNLQDNTDVNVELLSITSETDKTLTYEFSITFVDNNGSYNKLVYKIIPIEHVKIK